jgi:hypothetical protein
LSQLLFEEINDLNNIPNKLRARKGGNYNVKEKELLKK